jgi:hypothetical protein
MEKEKVAARAGNSDVMSFEAAVDSVIIHTAFLIATGVDHEELKRSNTHSIAIRPPENTEEMYICE